MVVALGLVEKVLELWVETLYVDDSTVLEEVDKTSAEYVKELDEYKLLEGVYS